MGLFGTTTKTEDLEHKIDVAINTGKQYVVMDIKDSIGGSELQNVIDIFVVKGYKLHSCNVISRSIKGTSAISFMTIFEKI